MLQRLRLCRLGQGHRPALTAHASSLAAATCAARRSCSSRDQARRGRAPSSTAHAASSTPASAAPDAAEPTASTSAPGGIYARPELYDIAFSYRDFKSESKFLLDVQRQHGGGGKLNSVLELGCGPARHLAGLARAGVPKLVGMDLSTDMLGHARSVVAKELGPRASAVELLQMDMAEFDLPQHRDLDMVMCLLGTFCHLLDTQQAIACFKATAAHLRPGGLFLLELPHPGDLFDGSLIIGDGGRDVWEVPMPGPGNKKVFVEWGAELDNFDPVTQILFRTVTVNVLAGDTAEDVVEEVVPYRQYTVRELELLAGMAGLSTAGLYGEMRVGVDLEHEDAYRMVAVFKKP
ncbi:hypothetical protein HYH03_003471 [Edaphochlamys debaryana]|uniref:Methyltransferase domain-containing protein n=1 Tax=Edaphochlamys debaryana TaxID=47281 RepID=A0A836C349_9CHLO|nr:hypothetical protein HYH03_003471 [Edaphochlamys debaryana]|eukprot:KAG2498731.1 hypothetical protein HYH03_003471 [Edaphochlamys debaryana]